MIIMDENLLQDHNENVNPQAAVVLCSLGLAVAVVLFVVLMYLGSEVEKSPDTCYVGSWFTDDTAIPIISAVVFFLIAMGVLVAYAAHLRTRDAQDYYGKMRVTSARYEQRVESHSSTSKNKHTTYTHYYETIFTVDWGYEWACPSPYEPSGYKVCSASTLTSCTVQICGDSSCSDRKIQRALKETMECSSKVFDPTLNYTEYNPKIGPSQDVDWPNVLAYGDCDTCEVSWWVASRRQLAREHNVGLTFLGFTAVALVFCLMRLPQSIYRCECKKGKNDMEDKENVDVEVVADNAQSTKYFDTLEESAVDNICCTECQVAKHPTLFALDQRQSSLPICRTCDGVKLVAGGHFPCAVCGVDKPSAAFDSNQYGKTDPHCRICAGVDDRRTVTKPPNFNKPSPDKLVAGGHFACAVCGIVKPSGAFDSYQYGKTDPHCRSCCNE